MAAARKQSTALSYSEDRLKRTPSASWGGGAGNVIGFNGKFIKAGIDSAIRESCDGYREMEAMLGQVRGSFNGVLDLIAVSDQR